MGVRGEGDWVGKRAEGEEDFHGWEAQDYQLKRRVFSCRNTHPRPPPGEETL